MDERLQLGLKRLLDPRFDDGDDCALSLYRFAAGEASRDEERVFRQHLAQCAQCQENLELLRQWDQEQSRLAAHQKTAGPLRLFGLVLGPLAIAATLLMLVLRPSIAPDGDAQYKIKGTYALHVAVQRGTQRFGGVSGADFAAGDVLGFFYTAPKAGYMYLMFADEADTVSTIYPTGRPVLLPAGVEVALPNGAVLEPGHGCEWIVAVFSSQAVELEDIKQALLQALAVRGEGCQMAPLPIDNVSVDVFVLKREQS
jgi:hypothetical protein